MGCLSSSSDRMSEGWTLEMFVSCDSVPRHSRNQMNRHSNNEAHVLIQILSPLMSFVAAQRENLGTFHRYSLLLEGRLSSKVRIDLEEELCVPALLSSL